jgi:hypothetical protein
VNINIIYALVLAFVPLESQASGWLSNGFNKLTSAVNNNCVTGCTLALGKEAGNIFANEAISVLSLDALSSPDRITISKDADAETKATLNKAKKLLKCFKCSPITIPKFLCGTISSIAEVDVQKVAYALRKGNPKSTGTGAMSTAVKMAINTKLKPETCSSALGGDLGSLEGNLPIFMTYVVKAPNDIKGTELDTVKAEMEAAVASAEVE